MAERCESSGETAAGELTIRRFRLRDLWPIVRIERACFGRHAFDAPTFLGFALTGRDWFMVAQRDGATAGYVVARPKRERGRRGAHIVTIAVDAACRGRGVGRELIARLLDRLRSSRVETISLEVSVGNSAAIDLYHQFGFHEIETLPAYYGPGEDGMLMVLDHREQSDIRERGKETGQ